MVMRSQGYGKYDELIIYIDCFQKKRYIASKLVSRYAWATIYSPRVSVNQITRALFTLNFSLSRIVWIFRAGMLSAEVMTTERAR